ncbi:hypothetical protein KP509_07G084900 [Ceratopteris richardii]|uniref:K Homology domain-containing protein n=1 Tax=Ceratopteris richardii TaxID=49495 RepID=A0A8T2UE77_CERRI|nr:hypothetical protein KP509_07G084900 [Ceratopteris richardii]
MVKLKSNMVDALLLRFLVGKGGETKRKIEKDTSTHLHIPSSDLAKQDSSIVVRGFSKANVHKAVSQIQHLLQEVIESPTVEYSHFISLPLAVYSDLVVKVNQFHESVLGTLTEGEEGNQVELVRLPIESSLSHTVGTSACQSESLKDLDYDSLHNLMEPDDDARKQKQLKTGHVLDKSILIEPATLHLTVLMLKLWSKERVAAATEVLQGLNPKVHEALKHRPVAVRLKGLECMKGSPAKAHVLYAKVENSDEATRLLHACNVIKNAFVEAGLVLEKDKKQELKMHVTLVNTRHQDRGQGAVIRRRLAFDARHIISRYASEEWGEYTITEAHLSQRNIYSDDGYYHCCSSIKFPSLQM